MLTFPSAIEFDLDLLVHILCQVENIFLLGLFLFSTSRSSSTAASIMTTSPASLVTTTTTSEMSPLRHGDSFYMVS